MDIYKPIGKHVIYPLWILKNRSHVLKYQKEFERTQYLSPDEIKELQWQKLTKILKQAYTNCPFYTRRFNQIGMKPEDIKSPADFLKIPILSKNDIQENLADLKARNYPETELIKDMTGGSTGHPMVFYYDKERADSRLATSIRNRRWYNRDFGDKVASLWGAFRDISGPKTTKSKLLAFLFRQNGPVLDATSITTEKMYDFAAKLKAYRPKFLKAYANVMFLFASFLKENKITGINPEALLCTAEVLLPERRELIESVFGCKVYDLYGAREVRTIACECNVHDGMHINAESLYLEFVRNGEHVNPGELGEIIVTDLLNFGMPLIRYKIGDMGRPLDRSCSCGRGLPMMDHLEGRIADFMITPDGTMISGHSLLIPVFSKVKGLKQAQIIQEEIDRLRVKVVKNDEFTEDSITTLREKFQQFVTPKMKIDVEYVDNIPNESSGKYRMCISKIQPDFIGTGH